MIHDYLIHTITIEPPGTPDAWGQVAPGVAVTARARVESMRRLILDTQGQQVFCDARIFLSATTACVPGAWITFGGDRRQVVSVAPQQGLEGVHHLVAYLGSGVSG